MILQSLAMAALIVASGFFRGLNEPQQHGRSTMHNTNNPDFSARRIELQFRAEEIRTRKLAEDDKKGGAQR